MTARATRVVTVASVMTPLLSTPASARLVSQVSAACVLRCMLLLLTKSDTELLYTDKYVVLSSSAFHPSLPVSGRSLWIFTEGAHMSMYIQVYAKYTLTYCIVKLCSKIFKSTWNHYLNHNFCVCVCVCVAPWNSQTAVGTNVIQFWICTYKHLWQYARTHTHTCNTLCAYWIALYGAFLNKTVHLVCTYVE